jgi:hypothetical protein
MQQKISENDAKHLQRIIKNPSKIWRLLQLLAF